MKKIYVEGKSDLLFLSALLVHAFDFGDSISHDFKKSELNSEKYGVVEIRYIDLDQNGGIDPSKLNSLISEIENNDLKRGIKPAIILDTDTPEHQAPKGGFANRDGYLRSLCGDRISYFLVPNHEEDGNLENILVDIIGSRGKPYFNLLNQFHEGVFLLPENEYPPRFLKAKRFNRKKILVGDYAYEMCGNKKVQDRDYQDNELWNLDSPALSKLIDFFSSFLHL